MLSRLQKSYAAVTISSIIVVTILVIVGAVITTRPGLPTISRMMEDHPDSLPIVWVIFAMMTFGMGIVAAFVASGPPWLVGTRMTLTFLQFVSIVLVPLASLDYAYRMHMSLAAMSVVFTLAKGLSFLTTAPSRMFMGLHLANLVVIGVLGLVFVIFVNVRNNAEEETYISLAEYLLMMGVAEVNIFLLPALVWSEYTLLDEKGEA